MQLFVSLLALFAAQIVSASPLEGPILQRRASANDVATLGYATLNGGTKGGVGGPTTRVSTLAALTAAVAGNSSAIVIVSGTITGNTVVKVGSNKSVLGAAGASLVGVGLRVLNEQNVIIRNIKISKVLASAGDAIGIQASNQVWVDHVDLSSDLAHDKDYYDGLLDVTHGCVGITITNSVFHDHWKASLVGHSDKNGAQDVKITVTYANNYWYNINSRTPSLRFGHGHVFNTFFLNNNLGIDTRDGAQMLIENNVWSNTSEPIYQTDTGYAVATGNDFGGGANTAPLGTFTKAPYSYTLLPTSSVRSSVVGSAGATLSF